ncbi:putative MATE family efflux protein [Hypnocyclicus thermotrophus]|uniref:Multidrug-efflux transporter n=1 Tax=Hypnocyclicus thermotrophus TaxID=1627895 RepID=A0AA46E076_9FUSO|nr:MATE family efflux transporter [Hypnocyclicus thermotrophus]TDT71896.1 putative MATE family efflux protein [Hypnocyclicus thermotrophus]
MSKKINLTTGNIYLALLKLALPIMGTSFLQMAYNLTDMIWLGRLSSNAVAAVGTAGFFMWFGFSVTLISKTGVEVLVGQYVGANNYKKAKEASENGVMLNSILIFIYSIAILIFRHNILSFFNLTGNTLKVAKDYLFIVGMFFVPGYLIQIFSSIITGYGDSHTPFIYNTVGLILNIVLDPLFIFGFKFNAIGTAVATILSQAVVFILFVVKIKNYPFENFKFFNKIDIKIIKKIIKIGIPVAFQNMFFATISMNIAKIISNWGEVAIAIQKIGAQIESLSWMTAGGIATALGTFTAQNYGNKNKERIIKGYYSALSITVIIGLIATLLFYIFRSEIFKFFVPNDKKVILLGSDYLKILAISQVFMCLEITTMGLFNGVSKTIPPAIISIVFTGLRIPIAIYFAYNLNLGLNGVWWSISISSIIKGIVAIIWFYVDFIIKKKIFVIEG